jgi:tetratricopeptide (TPR) repeat protein
VHYLLHQQTERMADFQARLARLEEPRAAFEAAFAGVDWRHEQREVESLLRLGRLGHSELPMRPVEVHPVERALEPAEVHALRVELGSHGTRGDAWYAQLVQREVTAALREAPHSFHARLLEARTTPEPGRQLALARRLTLRHPGRSEAWALLAQLLTGQPAEAQEREAALTRGLQLAPDSPVLLNGLAGEYVLRGELQRALPLARRAVELAPWSPLYLGVYAAVLAGTGRCDQAQLLQGQAVSALGEDTPAAERQLYADTLAGYARCAAATGAGRAPAP